MPDSLSWSCYKLLVWKQFPQSDEKTRIVQFVQLQAAEYEERVK